ncbi:hypothetical protein [Kribbella sp. NPDC023855]|uniref:hypothetical protein n=1 Tax=Kribbella sp. NPDC023855 TaxID=3154698 RepID=UPI0033ED83DD
MFDCRERFRVQSPKGPYVGYGVCDAESGRFLTEVDLRAEQALTTAAALMVAAAPREVRYANLIRAVVPPRPVRVASGSGLLAAWAAGADDWRGYVLVDGEMQASWLPQNDLQPEA